MEINYCTIGPRLFGKIFEHCTDQATAKNACESGDRETMFGNEVSVHGGQSNLKISVPEIKVAGNSMWNDEKKIGNSFVLADQCRLFSYRLRNVRDGGKLYERGKT